MLHLTLGHEALAKWPETAFVTHCSELLGCIFQASSGVHESGAGAVYLPHNTDLKTAGSCFAIILRSYLQASEYLFQLILNKSLMHQDNCDAFQFNEVSFHRTTPKNTAALNLPTKYIHLSD